MNETLHVGLDVGSTTVKIIVMDKNKNTLYKNYQRHFSDTKNTVCKVLEDLLIKYPLNSFTLALTGSGAMSAAKFLGVDFIQEVVSCKRAVEKYIPKTDVVIELGGEDAKIIYFDQSIEQRMNGTCAGGTGAFLDQMASLLNTDTAGLNELAKNYKTIYPIASRCGVFAKTDIQPLINEGAAKEDIAASIFQAVVNQTISGLACGRPIRGHVAFLGGPLNYLSELRTRFIETLHLTDDEIIVPEEAHLLVAKGAALDSIGTEAITPDQLANKIEILKNSHDNTSKPLEPLFKNEEDYKEFKERHDRDTVTKKDLSTYEGNCYLGIDAGSTTTKLVLIDDEGNLLYSLYGSNQGNPLKSVMNMLKELYTKLPEKAILRYSGVTGYGEKLIQTALNVDLNEIETIAHYTAAKKFNVNVVVGMIIGATLCYPTIQTDTLSAAGKAIGTLPMIGDYYTKFIGIPFVSGNYTSTVVPVICIVALAAQIQKLAKKYVPEMLQNFFVPFFVLIISLPIGLLVIGPVVSLLTSILSNIFAGLYAFSPLVTALVVGAFWQCLVIFGLHWALVPMAMVNIGNLGYDTILPGMLGTTFAATGVVAAMYLKLKDKNKKALAIPAVISAFCGVTEPAIYGFLLPEKTPFVFSCIGGAVGGAIMGAVAVKQYVIGGLGIFGVVSYISPKGDATGMVVSLIAGAVSLVVGFVLTMLFYKKEETVVENKLVK